MTRTPRPVEEDARGIVDPDVLRRRVVLTRYPAGGVLDGLVDRFWTVRWRLPPGTSHTQQVLTHPGANLSIASDAPPLLHGVQRRRTDRTVKGEGWAVAAMTAPGGLGALVEVPVHTLTDRVVPLGRPVVDLDADALTAAVRGIAGPDADERRVEVLRAALAGIADRADAVRVAAAREVVAAGRIAEADRSVRRVEDLAARTGITVRTLQRLFARHAGVSPTWVVRRYRLLEAGERARHGDDALRAAGGWAALAAELGYSDQAHLSRDFRVHFGVTPSEYAGRQPS